MRISAQIYDFDHARYLDARSRVVIWTINNLSSPDIAKVGLTQTEYFGRMGVTNAQGEVFIHTLSLSPGLTLERRAYLPPPVVTFPNQPYFLGSGAQNYLESGAYTTGNLLPLNQTTAMVPCSNQTLTPCSNLALANYISQNYQSPIYTPILQNVNADDWFFWNNFLIQTDFYDTAIKLGMIGQDMDNYVGVKICRVNVEPPNGEWLDSDYLYNGNSKVYLRWFEKSPVEVKCFKYVDAPNIAEFFFLPRAGFYDKGGNTFSTDLSTVQVNSDIGWICTRGGVDKLDWGCFICNKRPFNIAWLCFPDDQRKTEQNFAEAFAIATQGKLHGVNCGIIKATITKLGICLGEHKIFDAEERVLSEIEIMDTARNYGLKVDQSWKWLPYLIDTSIALLNVRSFWKWETRTEFCGKESLDFLKDLLAAGAIQCPQSPVLILVHNSEQSLRWLLQDNPMVKIATFEALESEEDFRVAVQEKQIDLIILVEPSHPEDKKVKVTDEMLTICSNIGIPVGLFSRWDSPSREHENWRQNAYTVRKKYDGSFAVKDMNSENGSEDGDVNIFYRAPDGLRCEKGSIDDMKDEDEPDATSPDDCKCDERTAVKPEPFHFDF